MTHKIEKKQLIVMIIYTFVYAPIQADFPKPLSGNLRKIGNQKSQRHFCSPGYAPYKVSENALIVIEMFVILIYDK